MPIQPHIQSSEFDQTYPRLSTQSYEPVATRPPGTPAESETPRCNRVIVCSDRPGARQLICDDVRKRGLEVTAIELPTQIGDTLASGQFAACIVDDADRVDGVTQIAAKIQTEKLPTQLVCLVSEGAQWGREILPAFQCTIVEKPYSAGRIGSVLLSSVERAQLLNENQYLRRQLINRHLQDLVGTSPAMRNLRETIRVSATDDSPVLIRGESGTGTNLVAQGLHRCSDRSSKPFLRIDCSLHSAESLEARLFGDGLPGSGTEAGQGYLVEASGGTLLLDNVECVAVPLQKKLARVLESREFVPTGHGIPQQLNTRIIAATHQDLGVLARDGRFREDLLHSLSSVTIQTPPLRVRRVDIVQLVEHCLNELSVQEGRPVPSISSEALELLEQYDWPGNVRELQNILERASTLEAGACVTGEIVRPWLNNTGNESGMDTGMTLREMERKLIEATFNRYGGNREKTAQSLQIGLRTLSGKLREYGYPPRGGPGSNRQVAQRKAA